MTQHWRNGVETQWANKLRACVHLSTSTPIGRRRPSSRDAEILPRLPRHPIGGQCRFLYALYIFVKCCTTSAVFTRKRLDDRRSDSLKFVDQRDMMNYRLKLLSKAQRMIVG